MKYKTAQELKLAAVKHALSGGRIYGALQASMAFEFMAEAFSKQECDKATFITACKEMCNLSQLQQSLEKAGAIDRNSRAVAKASIWAGLTQ